MSAIAEHFDSIDARLEAAKQAWASERKGLEDQLLASQIELRMTREALAKAVDARDIYARSTAALLAKFGVVAQIFEDAREAAVEAGLYTKATANDTPAVADAKAAIDEAIKQ